MYISQKIHGLFIVHRTCKLVVAPKKNIGNASPRTSLDSDTPPNGLLRVSRDRLPTTVRTSRGARIRSGAHGPPARRDGVSERTVDLDQGACDGKPALGADVELLLHHRDLLLERSEERVVTRTLVPRPRPQTRVRELVAVRRDAIELRAQAVAQRTCWRRPRTQLARACEAVRVAQPLLSRGVALELRDVAHGDLLSALDGPQRADFGREHLFVPSEKRVRRTAVYICARMGKGYSC